MKLKRTQFYIEKTFKLKNQNAFSPTPPIIFELHYMALILKIHEVFEGIFCMLQVISQVLNFSCQIFKTNIFFDMRAILDPKIHNT